MTSPANALSQTDFTSPAMGFGGGKVGPQHFGNFANTGALEQTPHNDIHVALVGANPVGQCQGGFMIDPNCAALDPIFWLHHANIDRLWNVWLASGGVASTRPTLVAQRVVRLLRRDGREGHDDRRGGARQRRPAGLRLRRRYRVL